MLTTGNSAIDNLFKSAKTISSSHKVIAEWNHNAYTEIDAVGSYSLDIRADGNDETYSKTFNSSQTSGGWDNGGHYYTLNTAGSSNFVEDKNRKALTSIKEIVKPERPDPGIIHPVVIPSTSNRTLIDDSTDLRVYNILQSDNRIYPVSESQGSKYWTSVRKCKPNSTVSPAIDWETIGVSDSSGRMGGNNVFVHYKSDIRTNKIVVKTQTINGYARDFTVEVLPSGSTTWTSIYQTTNSTTMSDGILRLTRKYVDGSWQWVVAAGVEEEGALTSLLKSSSTGYQMIRGIRFSVQELADVATNNPKQNGTLDILEVSPRLVVDFTGYTTSLSVNSNLGDSVLGLPVGSIVSATGDVKLFNDDNLISNKNNLSILQNLLKPNVKFTILNVTQYNSDPVTGIIDSGDSASVSDETIDGGDSDSVQIETLNNGYSSDGLITKYIPIKVMYAESWDEATDWNVNVGLEDFTKFLRDTPAPDILMGALDGIRVSAIIKMLLDNAGFTRFSFNKTGETSKYNHEDTRLDFFYSYKEQSVAEVLDAIARSAQLSMYFDNYGILTAFTKEAVMQKTSSWDYTLVGDYKNITEEDEEYSHINGNYSSNIESFEDTVLPPITAGEVAYSSLGIPKQSTYLLDTNPSSLENPYAGVSTDTKKLIDAGYSEVSINRNLSYIPQQLWSPNAQESNDKNSILSAGVIVKDIESSRPKTILDSDTFTAENKNEAIRAAYTSMTSLEKTSSHIIIAENDLAVSFKNRFSGYVLVDSELIKYYGLIYNVTKPGYASERKIYFSEIEVNGDIASAPSGSSFVPYALLVYMDMEVLSYPTSFPATEYVFYCKEDGRGYENTSISKHYCGVLDNNGWSNFSSKLYASSTGQTANIGQSFKLMVDTGIPDLADINNKSYGYGGYAKLIGPTSLKGSAVSDDIKNSEINISDFGQQHITGFKKAIDHYPTRIGTRMAIVKNAEENESMSSIAGIGFFLSTTSAATTGYFVEVSTVGENYEPMNPTEDNLKFYRVDVSGGNVVPTLIGSAWFKDASPIASDTALRYASDYISKGDDLARSVFSIEVSISDNQKDFTVYVNGMKAITAHDPSPLARTSNVGVFVRDDSNAVFDYFYSVSTPNGVYPTISNSATSADLALYSNPLDVSRQRGIFSPFIKQIVGSETPIYYDDFGNTAREAKFIEVRYTEPAFASVLIELSKVSPDYFIKDFKSSPWGASFWIYNTARTVVSIGQGSDFPISISGIVLKKISAGNVSIGDYLEYTDDDSVNDVLEVNRRLYGENSINVSSEFLNNFEEAQNLASWIAKYASKEKVQINASIFPNPLLQIGDKVKVFYKSRGYCESAIGDKTYVLSELQYDVSDTGIQMNVSLREML